MSRASRAALFVWATFGCAGAPAPSPAPSAAPSARPQAAAERPAERVDPRCRGLAPRGPIEIAVTVDDLPRHGKLPAGGASRVSIVREMTSAFERHGVRGVVGFVNGARAETEDEKQALAAWVARGHALGNHGYAHKSAADLSPEAVLAEVDLNEPVLRAHAGPGGEGLRVFRFPYLHQAKDLEARGVIHAGLRARGYIVGEVTIDFADWAYTDPFVRCADAKNEDAVRALRESYLEQAEAALGWSDATACALFGRPVRHVLLLHVGAFTASQMDALLGRLAASGARFISLGEALEDPIYRHEPAPPRSVRGPLLYQVRASRGAKHLPLPAVADPVLGAVCR